MALDSATKAADAYWREQSNQSERADGHAVRLAQRGQLLPRQQLTGPDAGPQRVGNLLVRRAPVVRVEFSHVREGTGDQLSYTVDSVI